MSYDYSKLKGRIIEIFGNNSAFARAMPISERALSLKLTGKRFWTQEQMERAIEILLLSKEDIPTYFFRQKV